MINMSIMKIINIEKISKNKIIILTGRVANVRHVAKELQARLYYCPRETDYYMDYPHVVKELKEAVAHNKGVVAITTQSAEFLDHLLESDIDFVLATVRKYDHDSADTFRLRVLSKEEALESRRRFDMELRI